jgi:hypothetical protein
MKRGPSTKQGEVLKINTESSSKKVSSMNSPRENELE